MTEEELEESLSAPTPDTVVALARLSGDIAILGAGGKMGPSLARLAVRASAAAGVPRRVIAVSRFSDQSVREVIERAGIETISCDLFDRSAVDRLPDVAHVLSLAGRKFGTSTDPAATWATNTYLPALVAERFAESRIVAFSTGNVYPLSPAPGPGPDEDAPLGPVGEYATAAAAREQVLTFFCQRNATPMAFLRINYAIEPRYGVLRDIADAVRSGEAIDLGAAFVNVIWQRDANSIALRVLERCAVPPFIVNVTRSPAVAVRDIADGLARRFGTHAKFGRSEGSMALLSDASRCARIFGDPPVRLEEMIDRVADWVMAGGRSLGRPTHFAERGGQF
ncbi:MAG: NAD-dependent epimerase/dehydratase family protein [Gemmatimonadales bacterium]